MKMILGIKILVNKALSIFGIKLEFIPRKGAIFNPIHKWYENDEFLRLYDKVKAYSPTNIISCYILFQLVRHAASLNGALAEVGVYQGGTAEIIAAARDSRGSDKEILLFDTFSGMPDTDNKKDWHKKGDYSDTSVEIVKRHMEGRCNISVFPGFFPLSVKNLNSDFSLVHVDCDLYQSVKDCCEYFYPLMVQGGVMVFDDYGYLSCQGARIAVDEFFKDKPEECVYLPTGQVIVIKMKDREQ